MAKQFTIFYSWESDLPNPTNRGFIQHELEAVAKEFTTEGAVVVRVDRDTAGVAGSPDIGKTIFAKIDAADAFVADLSIINSGAPVERKTPNPNVVFELGWAFKSRGENKIITIMNTAFGGPEDLPFDLKQRRTVKYELQQGADKTTARKSLRDQLRAAIKVIVDAHHQDVAASAPPPPDRSAAVKEVIRAGRPSQDVEAKQFMLVLAEDLDKLDPHALDGDRGENLVKAIRESRSVVDDFGRVAQIVAAESSEPALRGLVQGFEHILRRYQFQGGVGSHHDTDFDFFKVVGHEMGAVLAGHLIRAERWQLLPLLLKAKIHVVDPSGDYQAGIERLSAHSKILAVASAATQPRRHSVHADLLKDRHESSPPVGDLDFGEFIAGDLFLCLGTHDGGLLWWYPRSAVYLSRRWPRFLPAATELEGAKNLATALGERDLAAVKARVTAALSDVLEDLRQIGAWGIDAFDPSRIATE